MTVYKIYKIFIEKHCISKDKYGSYNNYALNLSAGRFVKSVFNIQHSNYVNEFNSHCHYEIKTSKT